MTGTAEGLVLGAAASAGVAALLRALPWPSVWLARKPLGCPVCMGMHSAMLVLLFGLATGATDVTGVLEVSRTAVLTWATAAALVMRYFAFGVVAALALAKLFPPAIELPDGL